jgi:hypothetical protein
LDEQAPVELYWRRLEQSRAVVMKTSELVLVRTAAWEQLAMKKSLERVAQPWQVQMTPSAGNELAMSRHVCLPGTRRACMFWMVGTGSTLS